MRHRREWCRATTVGADARRPGLRTRCRSRRGRTPRRMCAPRSRQRCPLERRVEPHLRTGFRSDCAVDIRALARRPVRNDLSRRVRRRGRIRLTLGCRNGSHRPVADGIISTVPEAAERFAGMSSSLDESGLSVTLDNGSSYLLSLGNLATVQEFLGGAGVDWSDTGVIEHLIRESESYGIHGSWRQWRSNPGTDLSRKQPLRKRRRRRSARWWNSTRTSNDARAPSHWPSSSSLPRSPWPTPWRRRASRCSDRAVSSRPVGDPIQPDERPGDGSDRPRQLDQSKRLSRCCRRTST